MLGVPPAPVWIDAAVVGLTNVMLASGLVLVLSIMGILNWTHGELYMIASYVVYTVYVMLGMNYFVALVLATLIVAGLGVVIERGLIRPMAGKGFLAASVVTLGMIFVFQGAVTVALGPSIRAVPSALPGVLRVAGVGISVQRLAVTGIAIAAMLALYFFVNRTKTGLAVRAAAQDPIVAGLFGVPAGTLFSVVMAIGCGLAALAGGLLAPVYMINPLIGGKPINLALFAIVLGGMGSFKGAAVGGLLFGFASVIIAFYIGPWYELVLFLIIIGTILVRPQGLFGKAEARV